MQLKFLPLAFFSKIVILAYAYVFLVKLISVNNFSVKKLAKTYLLCTKEGVIDAAV